MPRRKLKIAFQQIKVNRGMNSVLVQRDLGKGDSTLKSELMDDYKGKKGVRG